MTADLTHDAARESLAALALDALDGAEREAVLAHVAGCAACTRELAELRAAAELVAISAPPAQLDAGRRAGVRARLLARAAAERGAPAAPAATPASTPVPAPASTPVVDIASRRPPRPTTPAWFAVAASVAAVALGLWGGLANRERNELRAQVGQLIAEADATSRRADRLARTVASRDSALASLGAGELVSLRLVTSGEARRGPRARMYWARATDAWVFIANDLPAAPAGRTYQLWLVTAGAPVSAGTFAPDSTGTALVRATYRLTPEQLKAVAVTVEPAGGVAAPTTTPVLVTAAE